MRACGAQVVGRGSFILYGGEISMEWTKPAFEDLRLGFELTLYIYNR